MSQPAVPWWRRHARLIDVLVAVAVLGAAVLGGPPTATRLGFSETDLDATTLALLVLASVLLVVRRDLPRTVWGATVLLAVAPAVLSGAPGRGLAAAVVALYTVAAHVDRRWAVGAALVTMTAGAAVVWTSLGNDVRDPVATAVLPWCALGAALGDAVRVNRQRLLDAEERARVAEQTREEEALRRVAEERLHLSRELHDVIGHHLAVINVQTGVAERLGRTDPDAAAAALAQARSWTAEALQQTGRLVGLLRASEDGEPREPAPHLDALPALVAVARDGGTALRWTQVGDTSTGDPLVDQHGYRIVQEALTNAARHGSGPVSLTTERTADTLRLEVRNPCAAPPGPPGHGLVGMRERVALCGGTLEAGARAGEYVVRVTLPVRAGTP